MAFHKTLHLHHLTRGYVLYSMTILIEKEDHDLYIHGFTSMGEFY